MMCDENTPSANIRSCAALVLLLLAFVPTFTPAQDASLQQSLTPGMRVRILAAGVSPNKVIGTVAQVSADSVTLKVSGSAEPVAVSREKIMRLDVSEGRRSRGVDAAISAGIGAGIGAVAGALAGSGGHEHVVSGGEVAGVCALLGAGVGALIGAAVPPGERWKEMSASHYRVSFSPRLDHGLDLGVAWRF